MGNFKVKVNSEAESREAQDLAIAAGYKMDDLFCQKWDDDFCYLLLCEDMSAGFGNEIMTDGDKPLSIGELRAMVRPSLNDQYAEIEQVRQHRHYFIDVSDVDEIDFYEIALRYNVTDPCIQHILKKCLAVGQRGQKDFHHDLKDIYDTAKRMLDVHGLDS